MRTSFIALRAMGFVLAATVSLANAADAKQEAIRKDREWIEGTWQVTELVVNGNPAKEEDARKITVVNGSDGTWSLRLDGNEITKGTSTIDPTQKPKAIDFTPTTGESKGDVHLGVYEFGDDVRTLCFAPAGQDRPTELVSKSGSEHILVKFKRVKSP